MSLEPSALDDLTWEPDNADDEQVLENWKEKLKAKYPVAGKLDKSRSKSSEENGTSPEGLRQRPAASANPTSAPAAGSAQHLPQVIRRAPFLAKSVSVVPCPCLGLCQKRSQRLSQKRPPGQRPASWLARVWLHM